MAQVTENFNGGHGRNVSQSTVHRTLLRMGLRSRRLVRVPMMTPVHHQKCLQWARERRTWTLEQWKKVAWSDESRFLLDHVDGRVRVRSLPGKAMAPGCAGMAVCVLVSLPGKVMAPPGLGEQSSSYSHHYCLTE